MFILPKVKARQSGPACRQAGFIDIVSAIVLAVILVGTATTTYLAQHGQDIRKFARNCGPDMIYCGGLREDSNPPSDSNPPLDNNPPPASGLGAVRKVEVGPPDTSVVSGGQTSGVGGGGGMSQADLDRQAAEAAAAAQAALDKKIKDRNDAIYGDVSQPTPVAHSHEIVIIQPTLPSTNSCADPYDPGCGLVQTNPVYPTVRAQQQAAVDLMPTSPPSAGIVAVAPTLPLDSEAIRFRLPTSPPQKTSVAIAEPTTFWPTPTNSPYTPDTAQPIRIVQSTPQPQPTTNPINPITIARGIVSGFFGGIITNPFAPKITPIPKTVDQKEEIRFVMPVTDVPQQASSQPTTAPSTGKFIWEWNPCGSWPLKSCSTDIPSTSQPTAAPVAVAQITPVVVRDNIIIPPTSAVSTEPTTEPQATPIVSAAPVFPGFGGLLGAIVNPRIIPIICRAVPNNPICSQNQSASTIVSGEPGVTPAVPPSTITDNSGCDIPIWGLILGLIGQCNNPNTSQNQTANLQTPTEAPVPNIVKTCAGELGQLACSGPGGTTVSSSNCHRCTGNTACSYGDCVAVPPMPTPNPAIKYQPTSTPMPTPVTVAIPPCQFSKQDPYGTGCKLQNPGYYLPIMKTMTETQVKNLQDAGNTVTNVEIPKMQKQFAKDTRVDGPDNIKYVGVTQGGVTFSCAVHVHGCQSPADGNYYVCGVPQVDTIDIKLPNGTALPVSNCTFR